MSSIFFLGGGVCLVCLVFFFLFFFLGAGVNLSASYLGGGYSRIWGLAYITEKNRLSPSQPALGFYPDDGAKRLNF